jgi:hypothetical protein
MQYLEHISRFGNTIGAPPCHQMQWSCFSKFDILAQCSMNLLTSSRFDVSAASKPLESWMTRSGLFLDMIPVQTECWPLPSPEFTTPALVLLLSQPDPYTFRYSLVRKTYNVFWNPKDPAQ